MEGGYLLDVIVIVLHTEGYIDNIQLCFQLYWNAFPAEGNGMLRVVIVISSECYNNDIQLSLEARRGTTTPRVVTADARGRPRPNDNGNPPELELRIGYDYRPR